MYKRILNGQSGQATIGLLIMVLFIGALVLWNTPDLSLTNRVAYASGGGGGGTDVIGPVGGGGGADALRISVATLTRVAGSSVVVLTSGGTSGLTSETGSVVNAVSTIVNSGQFASYRNLAISAIRQLTIALISHTIQIISKRIVELSA